GPEALLGHCVAVADAAGLNLDPHGPWSRVGDRALDELEGPAGARDLGDTHRGHEIPPGLSVFRLGQGGACCRPQAELYSSGSVLPRSLCVEHRPCAALRDRSWALIGNQLLGAHRDGWRSFLVPDLWHRLAGTGTGPTQPAGCAAARWIASTCVG